MPRPATRSAERPSVRTRLARPPLPVVRARDRLATAGDYVMTKRAATDRQIACSRLDDGRICLRAETEGESADTIVCSEYNALRLLAAMSMVLDRPLTKAAMKGIDL